MSKHPVRSSGDRPAVHSLDHFAIAVPDLSVARAFYEAFGLSVTEEHGRLALRTFNNDHVWGLVLPGPEKRLHHLSFAAFDRDLPGIAENLERRGIATTAAPQDFATNGLWIRDFDGVAIEIKAAAKSSPDGKSAAGVVPGAEGTRGCTPRQEAAAVRPLRLAHVLNFTSSVSRAIDFYGDAIGVRLSDRSGDNVAFLHGPHGSDHHMIAFARSDRQGFHHCAWDVTSFDDVGRGGHRMEAQGYRGGWGVGRHVLGSNYYYYVRDPWGSHCEYSYDIDYVPRAMNWDAGDYAGEDAIYQWGPDLPDDFLTNHELAAAGPSSTSTTSNK